MVTTTRRPVPCSRSTVYEILVAAMLQGAIHAGVSVLVHRADARAFERWTGQWHGD